MIFVCRSKFECSASSLYEFHAGPDGFSNLVGLSKKAKVVSPPPSLQPGSRAIVELKILPGIRIRWIALHTELVPGTKFVDIQESGPFAQFQHEHIFEEAGNNSSFLVDKVTCAPPWFVDHFLFKFILVRIMKKEFFIRHQVTAKKIGCNYRIEFCGRLTS
ncbi:SRPBCC family protein [Leptospira sarikeiensis]|uniref:Uncharacterized protein n=1 Tax=Leptospira sarikeiensis TaxID=2484943 RepID=A0A4R9JX49_9LEPT|nr:hypothetical protein [Leptospira sarikeiensis]TGL57620.1 hypothetical protein EHQ64_19685 [Leptospira sarikeiensis]